MLKRFLAVTMAATFVFSGSVSNAATPDLPSCDQWYPAAACNYTASSRPSSYPIQYVIMHKVEGSAASAASWFQNCAARASTHYIYNNSSGYCYQSVREKDIAWHSANAYYYYRSVGIEHGGYWNANDVSTACYDKSALETKSCIIYYGVPYSRNNIIGHSEVPNPNGSCAPGYGGGTCSPDPGPYWNWNYYMSKCNPNPVVPVNTIVDNASSGFSASSNWATGTSAADKYGSNYRFRSTAAGTGDAAVFSTNLANGGKYDISLWWTAGTNRSASVPIINTRSGGTDTTYVNMTGNGGKWNKLQTGRTLKSGTNTISVSVWTSAAGVAIADAAKWYGPY